VTIDLVIFDCDGVLVDSEGVANRIFAEELSRIGLVLDEETVCRRFVGLSMARCVKLVEEQLGRPVPQGFVARLQRRTFDAFREGLRPIPGVEDALRRIEIPVCVASSGEQEKMRLTLGLTGLLGRFEGRMFSATEVARGKPAPDLFLHAARSLAARPDRCVVIEDSAPGVVAARAAGMAALGYAGRGNRDELAEAGARVFDSMQELPGLVEDVARTGRET